MTPQEAIGRWDGFLGKIKERATSILAEAEEGCAMLLDLNNLDPLPMSNAWSAIEQQLIQLTSKIDDTWNEKVEPAFDEADWDWNQIGPQHSLRVEMLDLELVDRHDEPSMAGHLG